MSLNQQKPEQDEPLTQEVHIDVPNCVLGYPVVTQSYTTTTTTTNAASAGGNNTHTHTQESKNCIQIALKIVACGVLPIVVLIVLLILITNTVAPSFSLNKASISLIEDMKSNETITAEWNLDFTVENSNVFATINFEKIEAQVACLSKVSNGTVAIAGKLKLHAPLGERSMNATVTMVLNRSDIPEDLRGFQLKFVVIFQAVITGWGRYKATSVCKDTTVRFASKSGPGIFVDTQHFCPDVDDFDPMTYTFTPAF